MLIQFRCNPYLVDLLNEDVERSEFSTRVSYLNELLDFVVSRPLEGYTSAFDQLRAREQMFCSLPQEQIAVLATSQNRNYDQMLKHLVDIGLVQYPDILRPAS
jgi:hypothetical protein